MRNVSDWLTLGIQLKSESLSYQKLQNGVFPKRGVDEIAYNKTDHTQYTMMINSLRAISRSWPRKSKLYHEVVFD